MTVRVIFDVQGIQSWIGAGGKLLDLTGGSELLESLMGERLRAALFASHIDAHCIEQNAAGRIVLTVADEETATRFAQLWALVVDQAAPGLRYGLGVFDADENESEQRAALERDAATPRDLWPVPGPLVHRAQRTGRAAVALGLRDDGTLDGERAALDAGLLARREAGRAARDGEVAATPLQTKFFAPGFIPAKETDEIAAYGPSRYLAVVHADGSKIGEAFREVKQRAPARLPDLSTRLEAMTVKAARDALKALEPRDRKDIPFRPVLLGGDDMTVILPGCYGFDFAREYLAAFNVGSGEMLADFPEAGLEHFHAGAGVALVQPHFPLEDAMMLAGELCSWTKKMLDRAASGVALHRVTTASTADYEAVVRSELSRRMGDELWRTTAGPYVVGQDVLPGFASAEALHALSDAAKALSKGALRRPLANALEQPERADDALRRLEELKDDAGRSAEIKEATDRFLNCLVHAGFTRDGRASFWQTRTGDGKTQNISPLSDLHALL